MEREICICMYICMKISITIYTLFILVSTASVRAKLCVFTTICFCHFFPYLHLFHSSTTSI